MKARIRKNIFGTWQCKRIGYGGHEYVAFGETPEDAYYLCVKLEADRLSCSQ